MSTDKSRKMPRSPGRRFQNVLVTEPSVQDTISILSGIKDRYEVHHGGIRISDAALVVAASYSNRWITNRFLPYKAIDLVDEAASALRIQQESKPDAIQELDRQIMTINNELESLKKETDVTSMERMEILEDNLKSKQSEIANLTEIWNKKKLEIDAIKTAKSKLEEAKIELDLAQQENDFEKASRITYSIIPKLLEKLPKRLWSSLQWSEQWNDDPWLCHRRRYRSGRLKDYRNPA